MLRRAWLGPLRRSASRAYRNEYSIVKWFLSDFCVEWGERSAKL